MVREVCELEKRIFKLEYGKFGIYNHNICTTLFEYYSILQD